MADGSAACFIVTTYTHPFFRLLRPVLLQYHPSDQFLSSVYLRSNRHRHNGNNLANDSPGTVSFSFGVSCTPLSILHLSFPLASFPRPPAPGSRSYFVIYQPFQDCAINNSYQIYASTPLGYGSFHILPVPSGRAVPASLDCYGRPAARRGDDTGINLP